MVLPDTNPTPFERIETLFHAVSALPTVERQAAVDAARLDEPEIAEMVLQLLEADEEVLVRLAQQPKLEPGRAAESIPERIGEFRLLDLLGSGGMGSVYRARRETRHDASRTFGADEVALKILFEASVSATGIPTFLAERDALAHLSHSGIARLLDAGVTQEGLTWVAMELVQGTRLDTYAHQNASLDELLGVLIELCDALAYMHRHLMLHGDIKPSNVMVTSERHAKLLDFGTAQMLSVETDLQGLNESTLRPITMRYASPEYLDGQRLSTASDVYSLGITLYRILAGSLPAKLNEDDFAGFYEELRRDTVKPPCRAEVLTRLKISPSFARDLNSIVLRAISFQPSERYSSAAAVADDLRAARARGLVRARSGESLYRLRVLFRRNRLAMGAALSALLVIVFGIGVSTYQGAVARAAQRVASRRVQAERRLAHFLLFDFFDRLREQSGSIDAEKLAATEALRSLNEMTRADHDPELLIDSADGYTRLGRLLGSPYEEDLGDVPGGRHALMQAFALAHELVQANPQNHRYQQSLADARTGIAQTYMGEGKFPEARDWIAPAAETLKALAAGPGSNAETLLDAGAIFNTYGDVYGQEANLALHDGPRSIDLYRQAQSFYAHGIALDPQCYACRSGAAVESWKLGMLHREVDSVQALAYYHDALKAIESLPPNELQKPLAVRRHIFIRMRLAETEATLGDPSAAVRLNEGARRDSLDLVSKSPQDLRARRDLADTDSFLTDDYLAIGKPQEALTIAREYRSMEESIARLSPSSQLWLHMRFDSEFLEAKALRASGHPGEAESMLTRALEDAITAGQKPDAPGNVLLTAARHLSEAHRSPAIAARFMEREMKDNAEPDLEEIMELAQAESDSGNREASRTATARASAYLGAHPHCSDHDIYLRQLRTLDRS